MKKPLSKVAAILAAVFIALNLVAPSAFAGATPVVNATVTNHQSTTTVGAGTVTIANQDAADLPAEVWVNGAVYKTVTVAGQSSGVVSYTGLSAGDTIQVVGNHVLLATFTVNPVTIAVPGYHLTPAACVNGTLVSGDLRVVGAGNVTATINGAPAPRLFSGLGPVTLTFQATKGYTFANGPRVTIPLDLGQPVCAPPKKKEVPAPPIPDDQSGLDNDAVIIPASECAIYTTVSGTVLPAGRHLLKDYVVGYKGGFFTVLVHEAEGCELLIEHRNWPFNFSDKVEEKEPVPPVKEVPAPPTPVKESPAPAPQKGTVPVAGPAQPVAVPVPTATVQKATSEIQTAETVASGEGLAWFALLAGCLLVIAATLYGVAGRLRRS